MLNYSTESFLNHKPLSWTFSWPTKDYWKSFIRKSICPVIRNPHKRYAVNQILHDDPRFFYEVYSNLVELHSTISLVQIFNRSQQSRFQRCKGQYNSLTKFLETPIITYHYFVTKRGPIFQLVTGWEIVPPEEHDPLPSISKPDVMMKLAYLKDISTTLYMYYISISVALDSVFPTCKYLFNFSFSAPRNNFYAVKHIMTPDLKTHATWHQWKSHPETQLLLYDTLYVFRQRYGFYEYSIKVLITENKKNRLRSRRLEHTMEVPITN